MSKSDDKLGGEKVEEGVDEDDDDLPIAAPISSESHVSKSTGKILFSDENGDRNEQKLKEENQARGSIVALNLIFPDKKVYKISV
jgi:hypothetical protein